MYAFSDLTDDPDLASMVECAVRWVYERNTDPSFQYLPSSWEIEEHVAHVRSSNLRVTRDKNLDLDALNQERGRVSGSGLVPFLQRQGLVTKLTPIAYIIPRSVAEDYGLAREQVRRVA